MKKYLHKAFSRKNSTIAQDLKNNINNIKIEKKHLVDSDFNNEEVFDISDTEDMLPNEQFKKEFDFGKLEKRNKELNENKHNDANSAVLNQLKNIIDYEESMPNKKEFKDLNLTGAGISEPISDVNEYLVKRPSKNFVWGLGQQTKQKKCKYK
jgi:hypothetical protein